MFLLWGKIDADRGQQLIHEFSYAPLFAGIEVDKFIPWKIGSEILKGSYQKSVFDEFDWW